MWPTIVGNYGRQSLGEFDLTGALNELSEILHRHAIKLPNQSALLIKMLISLEGTLRELGCKRFDSLDIVKTFMRQTSLQAIESTTPRIRQARRIYLEAENFLEVRTRRSAFESASATGSAAAKCK